MPNNINRLTLICLNCGEPLPTGQIKFCSGKCKRAYNKRKKTVKKVNPNSIDAYLDECKTGPYISYGKWMATKIAMEESKCRENSED